MSEVAVKEEVQEIKEEVKEEVVSPVVDKPVEETPKEDIPVVEESYTLPEGITLDENQSTVFDIVGSTLNLTKEQKDLLADSVVEEGKSVEENIKALEKEYGMTISDKFDHIIKPLKNSLSEDEINSLLPLMNSKQSAGVLEKVLAIGINKVSEQPLETNKTPPLDFDSNLYYTDPSYKEQYDREFKNANQ